MPPCRSFPLSSLPVVFALHYHSTSAADMRPSEDADAGEVQALIDKGVQANDPVLWAKYLLQADKAAEKLERSKPEGCCGYRCVRERTFELHFRYNEIQGKENYQHDLLQVLAQARVGNPEGAEALVRLLPGGCDTIASTWTPYFKTVLSILETRQWKASADLRLLRIRAEAYETWWSLSKMTPNDALVTDSSLDPRDFADGGEQARERAIAAYRTLLRAGQTGDEMKRSLGKLLAGQDTQQRAYFCSRD